MLSGSESEVANRRHLRKISYALPLMVLNISY